MAYIKRNLTKTFLEANELFPVLLLTGARQVGKSTFLTHIAGPERHYVSLDDPENMLQAREDPRLFLRDHPAPVIIDEIQYAPQLFPHIKMIVDEARRKSPDRASGLYWLTGSQQFQLMKDVAESLAGRIGIFRLQGLSWQELTGREQPPFRPDTFVCPDLPVLSSVELYRRIWRGTFPESERFNDDQLGAFFQSYVQTYLERDVRDLAQVGDLAVFFKFLQATAARQGQLLSYASLAQSADISPVTAKKWLGILVASGIAYVLPAYHSNLNKRLTLMPKLYILDTGLAAWLSRWSSPAVLAQGMMNGAYFEAWCVGELLKSYWNAGQEPPFYLYRDREQLEIDIVIEQDGKLFPVEIKKSAAVKKEDVRAFSQISKHPVGEGALISMFDREMHLTPQVRTIFAGYL